MRQSNKIALLIYLLSLAVALLTSCSSKKTSSQSHVNIIERDSTVTTINYVQRDTIIYTPVDRILERVNISQIPTETPKIFYGKKQAQVSIVKDTLGNITLEAICNQLELALELKDKEIYTLRELLKDRKEKIFVPEPYIPFVARVFMWIGIIAVGGIFTGLIINKLKS